MNASASILVEQKENVLYVPIESVNKENIDDYYVVLPDNSKEKDINVGIHNEDYIEVIDGLKEGDKVKLPEKEVSLQQSPFGMMPQNEYFYIDEQIRRVILMMESQWSKKNINFNLKLTKVKIYADKDLLEQVWINLIGNAIKFSRDDCDIDIDVETINNKAKIIIKDYGVGIEEDKIDKIFDRFYQAEESRKIEGSGLGLSIVKRIINIHNGEIKIKSVIGKGTEFKIIL